MSVLNIKLEIFEGPLDLLYKLIKKNKVDIYDIPIVMITDQYLESIQHLPKDMESLSEFLIMASELLRIKTKMLLPNLNNDADGLEEDPRDELVSKLEELEMYKSLALLFKGREKNIICKEAEDIEVGVNLSQVLGNLSLVQLRNIFTDTIKRQNQEETTIKILPMNKEQYTVEKKLLYIINTLKNVGYVNFFELFETHSPKIEKVVTFMAMLELARRKAISITQRYNFDEIIVSLNTEYKGEEHEPSYA